LATRYASQTAAVAAEGANATAQAMAPQLGAALEQSNPGISKKEIQQVLDELAIVLREEVYEKGFFEEVFSPVYMKNFTLGELREIVDFNETPAGKKLLKSTVSITLEGMEITRTLIQARMPTIVEVLKIRMREKGIEIKI
jgi:hypothetical protein